MLFREADHGGEAQHQAAGVRLRRRSGCGRQRARGPVSGRDRGRRVAGAAGPFLLQGGSRLPGIARTARAVVFTVQDVLADPPFSRLDLVSCRNLLIYLRPEAQAKVISLFHFALREGGILLLGSSETVGSAEGRFEVISKAERIYRHIGRSRPGEFGLFCAWATACAVPPAPAPGQPAVAPGRSRRALPAAGDGDLCAGGGPDQPQARMPLFPGTDRPLSARAARATPPTICSPWRARTCAPSCGRRSSRPARRTRALSSPAAGSTHDGDAVSFSIDVQPVLNDGEELLLICFVDDAEARAEAQVARVARETFRGSPSSSRNSKPPERNCRARSATWKFRAKSRRRSTKRRCPSTRSSSRPTRSC